MYLFSSSHIMRLSTTTIAALIVFTLSIGGTCQSTPTTTPTTSVGMEGDKCGRFRIPPDPPCATNLTCVLANSQIPDLGGTCLPRSTSTPTPTSTASLGQEGAACNRFHNPPDPPCAANLTCVLANSQIPDLGGTCRSRPPSSTTTTPPPFTTSPPPTTTTRTRPCPTRTVSSPDHCPEDDLGCPFDCIVTRTTTVPPSTVPGCPSITPVVTVTVSRYCRYTCYGKCSTSWVSETAGW